MVRRCHVRQPSRKRLEAIWQVVEREPGLKPGQIARKLGIARSAVTRALPALEEAGLLLYEDDRGRLQPWGGRR
jgi:Mn-dependent DtxR family transcriptional regulator